MVVFALGYMVWVKEGGGVRVTFLGSGYRGPDLRYVGQRYERVADVEVANGSREGEAPWPQP